MILPVYNGTLIKKEDRWFVVTKTGVDGKGLPMFTNKQTKDIELEVFPTDIHPLEWLEKHLNVEVEFNLSKKFLAKETIWYAKIIEIEKQPTWNEIYDHYLENKNDSFGIFYSDFWIWLRENYLPPKKK
jgi:hypothetical protein